MSHPPETSRELAEVLFKLARATPNDESIINFSTGKQTLPLDRGIALIDAWVRAREAEVLRDKLVDLLPRLQGHYSVLRDFQVQLMQAEIEDAESALAAARKQLEETR